MMMTTMMMVVRGELLIYYALCHRDWNSSVEKSWNWTLANFQPKKLHGQAKFVLAGHAFCPILCMYNS